MGSPWRRQTPTRRGAARLPGPLHNRALLRIRCHTSPIGWSRATNPTGASDARRFPTADHAPGFSALLGLCDRQSGIGVPSSAVRSRALHSGATDLSCCAARLYHQLGFADPSFSRTVTSPRGQWPRQVAAVIPACGFASQRIQLPGRRSGAAPEAEGCASLWRCRTVAARPATRATSHQLRLMEPCVASVRCHTPVVSCVSCLDRPAADGRPFN